MRGIQRISILISSLCVSVSMATAALSIFGVSLKLLSVLSTVWSILVVVVMKCHVFVEWGDVS